MIRTRFPRRGFNKIIAPVLLLAALLAGCSNGDSSVVVPEANQLQVFIWPQDTQNGSAFDALAVQVKAQQLNISLTNLIDPTAEGADATSVLRNRMLNANPPDTFQTNIGSGLIDTWVKTDLMESLDQLWQDEGWNNAYPKQLADMVSYNGVKYGLPLNVQRSNMLWYNKKIFSDLNLTPPTTWDEFWQTADKIKAAGINPIAIGAQDRTVVLDVFDSILLANVGADQYQALYSGKGNWQDPKVGAAFAALRRLFSGSTTFDPNNNNAYLNWRGAVDFVFYSKAAMTILGDWAVERFNERGAKENVDYGWAPAPGTQGNFIVVGAALGLPKNAPHRDATISLLKSAGSLPAQLAMSKTLGALPTRADADASQLDAYSADALASLGKDRLLPSSAHGSAAPSLFITRLQDAVGNYLGDGDLAKVQSTIEDAEQSNLK